MSRFASGARAKSPVVLGLLAAASALVLFAPPADAQLTGTASKPLPNVLLLVDTSGSMERLPNGASADSVCGTGGSFAPNRWHILVQSLTGNVQAPSCENINRSTTAFTNEFQIGGQMPPDKDYSLAWHRLISGPVATGCTIAPWKMPGGNVSSLGRTSSMTTDATVLPDDAFMQVRQTAISGANGAYTPTSGQYECPFAQSSDGQLDNVRDFVRLGLMTFDSDPSAGLGVNSTTSPSAANSTPFDGEWSYIATGGARSGRPLGCSSDQVFDVGARHQAAPPWEGKMVGFPPATGTLFDIERANDQIQQVLLGTRPYGATPIDGMMDDAADYLAPATTSAFGPWSSNAATGLDYYVQGGCRDQYIILLTDGAPNLDMRPSCVGPAPTHCPFTSTAAQTADALFHATTGKKKVVTFVIGFSVNGTANFPDSNNGFPPQFVIDSAAAVPTQLPTCRGWYTSANAVYGGQNDPVTMATRCTALNPPVGSTAAACCGLNDIALKGSGGTAAPTRRGAFFAESQADLSLAFGSVLATVTRPASTRTVPGYSPVASLSGGPTTGTFVASFIPNTQKVWSGEIDRTRSTCTGVTPTSVPQSLTEGDSYAYNVAQQASAKRRLFITVKDAQIAAGGLNYIDSAGSIRPFPLVDDGLHRADATYKAVGATEYGALETTAAGGVLSKGGGNVVNNWDLALGIDNKTCKSGRGIDFSDPLKPTIPIPALTSTTQCAEVVWGFATASTQSLKYGASPYEYNVRCIGGFSAAGASAGKCSISGVTCSVAAGCDQTGAYSGQECVPSCSALGAVYRSSPVVVGPPVSFSSDEGFRNFQQDRNQRRPMMFTQTADGVLHGFKALPDVATPTTTADWEQWAFVPPAILPRLAANYPAGNQILLDGTPTVKDTVWDRIPSSTSSKQNWHTTLVSGLGINGGGYYAVNVTDADCANSLLSQTPAAGCVDATNGYESPTANLATNAGTNGQLLDPATKRGPHFLWQLTDTPSAGTGEKAKVVRTALGGAAAQKMVSFFGKQSGTPAITTLNVLYGGIERQLGVAILPGGIDGPPASTGTGCPRASKGNYGFTAGADRSDGGFTSRGTVLQWGADCTANAPVAGRGVTIVRLDTGEILRHFGRPMDTPLSIQSATPAKFTAAPFDAPIIGTPVVYPNNIDTSAQKIFVGDADATVWRIDVASSDPTNWKVELFADLAAANAGGGSYNSGQPIQIPMSLSTSPTGNLVINVATGDQENIIASTTVKNWLYSIEELRPVTAGVGGQAAVRWWKTFTNAERVTGPMVVFDRSLYFATYQPEPPTQVGACGGGAQTRLWGMDYLTSDGTDGDGGVGRWCDQSLHSPVNVSAAGACKVGLVQFENVGGFTDANTGESIPTGSIIPGVTVKQSQSCATYGALPDGSGLGYSAVQPVEYQLSFGVTAPRSAGALNSSQAGRLSPKIPVPRINTSIDAWSIVVE